MLPECQAAPHPSSTRVTLQNFNTQLQYIPHVSFLLCQRPTNLGCTRTAALMLVPNVYTAGKKMSPVSVSPLKDLRDVADGHLEHEYFIFCLKS